MQPRHRAERAEPGSKSRKRDLEHIPGVTDHREGGKEIPDRAPIRCPDSASARYCRIEEHVGRVGGRCRSERNHGLMPRVMEVLPSLTLRTPLSENDSSHDLSQTWLARDRSMKTSKDRILTTHTGSLPRPKPLIELILER